jgi:arylsulfatase A-like enzyme
MLSLNCQKQQKPLNVVVLFTDDQRWNTIHALGNEEIHTPTMDKLAEIGVSFTRAHVLGSYHGAVCAPSRAMLLTGKPYMNIPRSYIDQGQLPPDATFDFVTFPEYLKSKGYQTYFTGKWHNHTSKIAESFDDGKNMFLGGMHWPGDGGHKKPMLWDFNPEGLYNRENRWQGDLFSSKMYSNAAIEFIENQDSGKPFCLYVAYTSPHDPREAPDEFLNLYDTSNISLPPNFLPEHPFDNGHLRTRDENLAAFPRTERIAKKEIAAYYAMISEVDAQIGRVIDVLEAKGMMDHTVIVFAGDNGLAVGQHGLLGKQSVYDHSVRVPLIISAPGINGNRTANTLCSLHDVYPTIMDILQLETPPGVEGISLEPALKDENHETRDALILSHAKEMRAIRTKDDFKLIHYFVNGKQHEQLFDLSNDPWEITNLAADTSFHKIKKDLSSRLLNEMQSFNDAYIRLNVLPTSKGIGLPVQVNISTSLPGATIKYTTDTSLPTIESKEYTKPLQFEKTTEVRAAIFQQGKQIGETQSAIAFISPMIASIHFDNPPSEKYPGFGSLTLANGPNGTNQMKNGHWIGYEGDDLICTVKLQNPTNVKQVGFRYLNQPGNWIFPPQGFEVKTAQNNMDFKGVVDVNLDPSKEIPNGPIDFMFEINEQSIRFLKITIKNIGTCPDWHMGNGQPAWLFVDEIFVL